MKNAPRAGIGESDAACDRAQASLDVPASFVSLGEMFCRRVVEPATGLKLWENGLGDVTRELVAQQNLPARVTAVDVGRAMGILRKPKKGAR